MNDENSYDVVWLSYLRCCDSPGFLDTFYDLFLNSSEEVTAKFVDTDFDEQKRVLLKSLVFVIQYYERNEFAVQAVDHLSMTHNRSHHDIPPHLYDVWLDCLVESVSRHDDQYSESHESHWRRVMAKGIEVMKERY